MNVRGTNLRAHEILRWHLKDTRQSLGGNGKAGFQVESPADQKGRETERDQADLAMQGEWGTVQKGDQSVSQCAFC